MGFAKIENALQDIFGAFEDTTDETDQPRKIYESFEKNILDVIATHKKKLQNIGKKSSFMSLFSRSGGGRRRKYSRKSTRRRRRRSSRRRKSRH